MVNLSDLEGCESPPTYKLKFCDYEEKLCRSNRYFMPCLDSRLDGNNYTFVVSICKLGGK